jgi:hypothetical protein
VENNSNKSVFDGKGVRIDEKADKGKDKNVNRKGSIVP